VGFVRTTGTTTECRPAELIIRSEVVLIRDRAPQGGTRNRIGLRKGDKTAWVSTNRTHDRWSSDNLEPRYCTSIGESDIDISTVTDAQLVALYDEYDVETGQPKASVSELQAGDIVKDGDTYGIVFNADWGEKRLGIVHGERGWDMAKNATQFKFVQHSDLISDEYIKPSMVYKIWDTYFGGKFQIGDIIAFDYEGRKATGIAYSSCGEMYIVSDFGKPNDYVCRNPLYISVHRNMRKIGHTDKMPIERTTNTEFTHKLFRDYMSDSNTQEAWIKRNNVRRGTEVRYIVDPHKIDSKYESTRVGYEGVVDYIREDGIETSWSCDHIPFSCLEIR